MDVAPCDKHKRHEAPLSRGIHFHGSRLWRFPTLCYLSSVWGKTSPRVRDWMQSLPLYTFASESASKFYSPEYLPDYYFWQPFTIKSPLLSSFASNDFLGRNRIFVKHSNTELGWINGKTGLRHQLKWLNSRRTKGALDWFSRFFLWFASFWLSAFTWLSATTCWKANPYHLIIVRIHTSQTGNRGNPARRLKAIVQ